LNGPVPQPGGALRLKGEKKEKGGKKPLVSAGRKKKEKKRGGRKEHREIFRSKPRASIPCFYDSAEKRGKKRGTPRKGLGQKKKRGGRRKIAGAGLGPARRPRIAILSLPDKKGKGA